MKKHQPRRRPQKPRRRPFVPTAQRPAASFNPYTDPDWGPVQQRHDAMPDNRGRFDIIDEYVDPAEVAAQIDYWEAFYSEHPNPDAFNESVEEVDQSEFHRLHIAARSTLSDHVQQLGRRRDEIEALSRKRASE